MWLIRGILLGLALAFFGTIAYLLSYMLRGSSARATGLTVIKAMTIYNPLYWLSFIAALVVGCLIVRSLKHT